jgi:opine dehydrogenase
MPISEGLLAIASGITGETLYESGRSLEALGLANLTKHEMKNMLKNGINI